MGRFGDWLSSIDPTTFQGREKVLKQGVLGASGMIGGRLMSKKRRAEEAIRAKEAGIAEGISGMTRYDIPEEVRQNLELMQQTQQDLGESAEAVRGTTELAGEATDIARARTGVSEMPGEALARKDIQQSTAGTVQNIMEAGGGSTSTLGAIAQAGLGEQSAFGNLAMQRGQYKSQAEQDLMNSLSSEAGFTAQAEAQAAGLETQGAGLMSTGLLTSAQQQQQQFEYGREQELTGLQFNLGQLGGMKADEQARRARNAQIFGSIIGSVGSIGGAMMGNPMALANIGSNINSLSGGGSGGQNAY